MCRDRKSGIWSNLYHSEIVCLQQSRFEDVTCSAVHTPPGLNHPGARFRRAPVYTRRIYNVLLSSYLSRQLRHMLPRETSSLGSDQPSTKGNMCRRDS
jgi:hypothetical protein